MAKSKGLNPADSHRKNQRKKEVQKNKEARKKTREFTAAKQDTGPIEEQIEAIEAKPSLSAEDKQQLSTLRADLKRLLKAKEEYLKEHPEHRALVYASAHKRQKGDQVSRVGDPTDRNVFGKDGLPLRPERSIYYDPVMNPYGIPPPGMLYMERPATPDETQMEEIPDTDSSDEEEDIPMPTGPRPGGDSDSSDEEVPMPPTLPPGFVPPLPNGPPPPNAVLAPGFTHPILLPPHPGFPNAPFPPGAPGFTIPPPPPGAPTGFGIPPPPPPPGFPPAFPLNMPSPYATTNLPPGAIPPPPFGFPNFPPNFPPPPPQPPRDFRRSNPTHQFDPLSIPGVSAFQAYQAYDHPTPPQPTVGTSKRPSTIKSNAPLALDDTSGVSTIFAAPELRDLKKEATAFVPRGIRQKTQVASAGPRVNAAPGEAEGSLEEEVEKRRPDLMAALAKAGITAPPGTSVPVEKKEVVKASGNQEQQEEYERFMDDVGDLLK